MAHGRQQTERYTIGAFQSFELGKPTLCPHPPWASSISRPYSPVTHGLCIEALEEFWATHGRPEIFNSDQGTAFAGVLAANEIKSMDGKGA